ncbi:MAG: GIY-YIG nuclease family protein [Symploca sp. SIO2C1]|nr:GIY-YIG nuclease family protein [Symploca sp. SIO2C1]
MGFDDSHYRNKPGFIYLIHAQGTDRYKIGLTTRHPEARLSELNSSQSPYPLELIDWFETDNVTEDECYLHEKFARYRVHGEWFGFDSKALKKVRREYQDDVGFTLLRLPMISLPALLKISSVSRDKVGLAIAGVGALWLIVVMSGCLPKFEGEEGKKVYEFLGSEEFTHVGF